MSSLRDDFEAAASFVSSGQCRSIPTHHALRLYGLFSVVRKGSCPGVQGARDAPSAWLDPQARAKWDAWMNASDLSENRAMREYVELVEQLKSSTSASLNSPSTLRTGLGPVVPSGFELTRDGHDDHSDIASMPSQRPRLQPKLDLSHWASLGDHRSIQTLLRQGHAVDARDEENWTALMRAADRGHLNAVQVLLNAGADLALTDDDGQTALHIACFCGHLDASALLLARGADPNNKDYENNTALALATFPLEELQSRVEEFRSQPNLDASSPRLNRPVCPPNTYWIVALVVPSILVIGFLLFRRSKP
mmetsp:Transcript_4727/g.9556  ORF Transcript_4727/g.9556 Transcript_4727/m.9556 type:complete len:308 (-) Transcript_4727:1556-2479(-)